MYCVYTLVQKYKIKCQFLPFRPVTLLLIDKLTLVKCRKTSVFSHQTLLLSPILNRSSVITCKNATTSGIFSIGVGYCVITTKDWNFFCNIHVWFGLVFWEFTSILAVFQPYLDLEAGDNQSLKIQVARPRIEPRSSCSASQELNHSATAAP